MGTTRLTVGQALVRFLSAQYVERDGERHRFIAGVWGIFGHGNVGGFGQALEELGDSCALPYYKPQNEQAQVHASIAYAKHHNRLRTFACTTSIGPGATNMVTGAATASINRIPVLLLPSDYFAARTVDPVLQQVEHPVERDVSASDAFRPVSRFFDRISRPEQLLGSLPEAFRVLTDPADTGAVTISLPEDVQAEVYDWPEEFFAERTWKVRRPRPDADALAEVVDALVAAKRPLIVAGGGAIYSGAEAELAAFAEEFGVPVSESQAGKGVLPWNHPMMAGPVGANGGLAANRLARDADVVIALGTRLGDFVTSSRTVFQNPEATLVGVNIGSFDAHKLRALPVVADAWAALQDLAAALRERGWGGTSTEFRDEVGALQTEWQERVEFHRTTSQGNELAQPHLIGIVNDELGGHGSVVCAAGSLPGDLLKLWRPEDSKAYHVEYGNSCMGYEIAAGLGVAMAEPGRRVAVAVGDGSYLMMNSEIVTSVAEGVPFVVVVFDNHGFQCIKDLASACGVPPFGNELRAREAGTNRLTGDYLRVDFAAHAAAMGAHGVRAETEADVRAALRQAFAADRTTVIHVPVSATERAPSYEGWWAVPPAEVSTQGDVNAARARFEESSQKMRGDLQ